MALKLCHLLCLLLTIVWGSTSLPADLSNLSCIPATLFPPTCTPPQPGAHLLFNVFIPLLFTLPSLVTPVPSRLISSSPVLPHSRLCSIYFTRQRADPRILCPCELNWSMEIDLLKYLLWNLLCDDNSRPHSMPNWEEKVNPYSYFCWKKKRKNPTPLKSISQALKCKLLSLVGSPLYMGRFSEDLRACNLGMHPILCFSNEALVNYSKMSCCCWDFLLCYFTAPIESRTCGDGLTLQATFALLHSSIDFILR